MTTSFGKTISDQTEATIISYNDATIISQLGANGQYSSFKATQQNLTKLRTKVVTGAYIILPNDDVIQGDTSGGSYAVTLPSAVGIAGVVKVVKKITSANTLTIACAGSQTIDGIASFDINSRWTFIRVMSDGTNWITI